MFFEDKTSGFVKSSYETDQHIAQEMNIQSNPSLVIFDNYNQQYGVLLEDTITYDLIEEAFDQSGALTKNSKLLQTNDRARILGKEYLRIIK